MAFSALTFLTTRFEIITSVKPTTYWNTPAAEERPIPPEVIRAR